MTNSVFGSTTATNAFYTNLSATNFNVTNFTPTNITWVNATGTNTTSTSLGVTGLATIQSLVVSGTSTLQNVSFTGATGTSLSISGLTQLATLTWTNATATTLALTGAFNAGSSTVTTLNFTNASGSALNLSGPFTFGGATGTSLSVSSLLVGGSTVCLSSGTNCPASTESDTFQTVTNRGNQTTTTIQFAGGTSTGNFIVSSGSRLGIGISAPGSADPDSMLLLDIEGASNTIVGARIANTATGTAATTEIRVYNDSGVAGTLFASNSLYSDFSDIANSFGIATIATGSLIMANLGGGSIQMKTLTDLLSGTAALSVRGSGTYEGYVGLATTTPFERLTVAGNIYATGTIYLAGNATSTFLGSVSSTNGEFSNRLTVGGILVCLANGTNCPSGIVETDTLASVTQRGATATTTVTLFGGLLTSSLTATGSYSFIDGVERNATSVNIATTNLTVTGTSNLNLVTWNGATGTNLFVSNTLGAATGSFTNLTTSNFTATNATTTNLTVTGNLTMPTGSTLAVTNITWVNATGTYTTTTNLYVSGLAQFSGPMLWTNATATTLALTGAFNAGSSTVTTLNFTNASGSALNLSGPFTFGGATGTSLSVTNAYVNGQTVCLTNGINCAVLGSDDWTYSATNDFVRPNTNTTGLVLGASTVANAPYWFRIDSTSSRAYFGAFGSSTNVVIGGPTSTIRNRAFQLNGDDLFVAGNIGAASSIYTNGAFVAGGGTTYYGEGFLSSTGTFVISGETGITLSPLAGQLAFAPSSLIVSSTAHILPSSDITYNLGRPDLRWLGLEAYNVTSTNATTTNLFFQYASGSNLLAGTINTTGITWQYATGAYTTTTYLGVTDGLTIPSGGAIESGGAIIMTTAPLVTSTGWIVANNTSTGLESIRSLQGFNNFLYAGAGDGTGDGDVFVCDPLIAGDRSICDSALDWATSTDSASASQVMSMAVYNKKLYIGQGSGAGLGVIRYCDPALTGNPAKCESGDWATATSTGYQNVRSMSIYNGFLYGAVDNNSSNQTALVICQPANAGSANDCDNTADWTSVNALGASGYDQIPALGVFLNRLYILPGATATDGDVWSCNPSVAGNPSLCDNASDWTMSVNVSVYESNESAAVYNGLLYTGKGNGGTHGDLTQCNPTNAGVQTVCDSTSDISTVIDKGGTFERVSALTSFDGSLFIGYTGGTGDGDIDELRGSFVTTTDTGTGYEATHAFAAFQGVIYAGRGTSSGDGKVFYYRKDRLVSQTLQFQAGSSTGNFWFSQESYNQQGEGSVAETLSGVFKLSHGLITEAGAYDIAEMYPVGDVNLSTGDVVVFSTSTPNAVERSMTAYDAHAFGVVSNNPAFLISSKNRTGEVPIAIAGRVTVKFSAGNGAINVGDPLTTATSTGYAMLAIGPGPIIGRALVAFDPVTVGQTTTSLLMVVQPGFYIPSEEGKLFTENLSARDYLQVGVDGVERVGASAVAQFQGATDTYLQVNLQNASTGTTASGDFVVTADNGDDSTYYIDMGINGSGYDNPDYSIGTANDGYLYVHGGNLTIGTASATDLIFHTGGTLAENERMRITTDGFVGIGKSDPTEALEVNGTVSTTGMLVNGVAVCLADGTNCPASGGSDDWAYSLTNDFVRPNTNTTGLVLGASTVANAPYWFRIDSTSSRAYFGAFGSSTNVVIGGPTSTIINPAFQLDGNDLFVAGNIGSASSVYTNGTFFAGGGTTSYGDGTIMKDDGDFVIATPVGDISLQPGLGFVRSDATLDGPTGFQVYNAANSADATAQFMVSVGGTMRGGLAGLSDNYTSLPGISNSIFMYGLTTGTVGLASIGGGNIQLKTLTDMVGGTASVFIEGSGANEGYVGIGTSAPTERLTVAGNILSLGIDTTNATSVNATATNLFASLLTFTNASGSVVTTTNLAVNAISNVSTISGPATTTITATDGDLLLKDKNLTNAIALSQSGETELDSTFTAESIIGALNELKRNPVITVSWSDTAAHANGEQMKIHNGTSADKGYNMPFGGTMRRVSVAADTGPTAADETFAIRVSNGVVATSTCSVILEVSASSSWATCSDTFAASSSLSAVGSFTSGVSAADAVLTLFLELSNAGVDIAEYYPTDDQTIGWGDVVGIDPDHDEHVVKSPGPANAIGIISTSPGKVLGKPTLDGRLVALKGRVPVNIAPDSEPIRRGDWLRASKTNPGKAERATSAGYTIGRALSNWDPLAEGEEPNPQDPFRMSVMAFTENMYYMGPEPVATSTDSGLDVPPVLTEADKEQALSRRDPSARIAVTGDGGAIARGDFLVMSEDGSHAVRADRGQVVGIAAESLSGSGKRKIGYAPYFVFIPSEDEALYKTAALSSSSTTDAFADDGLPVSEATTTQGVSVATDVVTSPDIWSVSVEGAAVFERPVVVKEAAEFRNTVVVLKHLYQGEDAAGYAKLLAGDKIVEVRFRDHYLFPPVITITPHSDVPGRYWVERSSELGFTIRLSDADPDRDITFAWAVTAVKEPVLYISDGTWGKAAVEDTWRGSAPPAEETPAAVPVDAAPPATDSGGTDNSSGDEPAPADAAGDSTGEPAPVSDSDSSAPGITVDTPAETGVSSVFSEPPPLGSEPIPPM
ncbi:MAG TPA: hypothetical protein VN397_00495 [Candidatus Methylomirabilis sp.]|nr:hypothetical protein [Candidatus Methylomirabilis sp.]